MLWAGFLLCGGLLIVFRNWWVTLAALLGEYLLSALLVSRFPFILADLSIGPLAVSQIVLVKVVAGLVVVGILAITAASRQRARPEVEHALDEITAARLRWAARRVARRGREQRLRLPAYLLPVSALIVLVLVTHALAILAPLARVPTLPEPVLWGFVDLAWYWLGLSGAVVVLFAQELQEFAVGLLLCMSSVDLLYTALSRSVGLVAIGLLSVVSILLALASAYLARVFYLRLQRWLLPSPEEWD